MGRSKLDRSARKKGSHLPEVMKTAVNLHLSGMSMRSAAKNCKVPYPTLRRYVIKYLKDDSISMEANYFAHAQESSLKEYILDCSNKFYGLTTKECRRLAFQMAETNKIDCPANWKENRMAGKDWLRGFKKRHPDLSIKKPEACSIARATAFNPTNVKSFFDNLQNLCRRFPQFGDGTRIYNLDETATTTVQRPGKVLAQKGKNVSKVTSGERGILVTTCCIVNATGHALPPVMVFPRIKFVPHMINGAPTGTLGLASKTGWMNSDLFVDVIKHFVKFTSSSKENPSLLIMDNHESHLSIEALNIAKNSGVTVLTLHPHTTSKLQPLDVGLNAPFKSYYNAAVDLWLLRNPGRSFSIYHVAQCVGQAYQKAMTPINITNAFKKCGIFPFNSEIFSELDFLPSSVTDRPEPVMNGGRPTADDDEDATSLSGVSNISLVDSRSPSPSLLTFDCTQTKYEPKNLVSLCLGATINSPSKSNVNSNSLSPKPSSCKPFTSISADLTKNEDVLKPNMPTKRRPDSQTSSKKFISVKGSQRLSSTNQPSTLTALDLKKSKDVFTPSTPMKGSYSYPNLSENFISPTEFRPALKAGQRKIKQGKRKAGKSLIATDTPEKKYLAEMKALAAEKKKSKPKKTRNMKAVGKVTKKLFKHKDIKRRKKNASSSESSNDDQDEFHASGSSSGGELFEVETYSDEDEVVLKDDNFTLHRSPRENDFVLILFKTKNDKIYYVAKVLEVLDETFLSHT